MNNTQHLVQLNPTAVELVDRTMIDLALEIPAFKPVVETLVDDTTDALLLVEFAGDDPTELRRGLDRLEALMTDIDHHGQVIRVEDGRGQQNIWNVRKAGLNIMMSMKGDGKPISFIEDCAVPLDHLADYTSRLNDIFAKYGTKGTWYAHASVGCLHVRPVLNVKNELDVKKMRAIAEETFAMVREYKGSHSGEHGDGIVRSEFHEPMLGRRIVAALEEVKDVFDPDGFFNPGRIVRAPKMDDRALFRYFPQYQPARIDTALNWSDWGGFSGAVEMCNNNGACRKSNGVMCPSFQATGDEMHLTRGRANSLRLALTGQLPAASLISEAMKDTMALCVSCKGCKRECPTGVDMARMKIEFMHHYRKTHAASYRDRLVAWMPRYAHRAAPLSWLIHARNHSALLRRLGQKILGINANRSLMPWHKSFLARTAADAANMTRGVGQPAKHVALFVDTFTNTLESEHAAAAVRVLAAAGYSVEIIGAGESRPYCCGRTFLTQGFVDEAKHELHRLLDATKKLTAENVPIIGLEPSCILGLKDECVALVDDPAMKQLANSVTLFEEFVAAESQAGRFSLDLRPAGDARALLHGHCHQKAFDVMTHIESTLQLIPQLEVETIDSGCCGMAGAFGYEAEHHEVSIAMAERTLLPKIREADAETYIVAGGTSCRHQIKDGTSRTALHPASLLDKFLA